MSGITQHGQEPSYISADDVRRLADIAMGATSTVDPVWLLERLEVLHRDERAADDVSRTCCVLAPDDFVNRDPLQETAECDCDATDHRMLCAYCQLAHRERQARDALAWLDRRFDFVSRLSQHQFAVRNTGPDVVPVRGMERRAAGSAEEWTLKVSPDHPLAGTVLKFSQNADTLWVLTGATSDADLSMLRLRVQNRILAPEIDGDTAVFYLPAIMPGGSELSGSFWDVGSLVRQLRKDARHCESPEGHAAIKLIIDRIEQGEDV